MLILILVRSYLSPIISTASSSRCVSLFLFVAPHPFSPLYPFVFISFVFVLYRGGSFLFVSLSLSLPPTLSLTLVSFAVCPFLYTSFVEFDSPDIPLSLSPSSLYAAFSPPPRNSMCSSSTCSALGRCQTSVHGFQLCPPLAVQLLSFRLVSAFMAAATHSKP